ncbi:hypothetical protein RB213_011923 [Colletotrichum asianum]
MASIAAGMKRKGGGEDSGAAQLAPKRRLTKHMPFWESKSIWERAKPYLLAVGKLHVDVMDTTWSTGRNHRVKPGHTEVFMKGGLKRGAPENHLFVLCGADEVHQIRQRTDSSDTTAQDDSNSNSKANFLNWSSVNKTKVEHQLYALQQYIKATGAPESDAWWTCELYDKDQLPADLNIKLRVNRRDLSLPDNHRQIWNYLVLIALVEALHLSSEKSFPTRQLVTLWNHKGWREITTRWCQTHLGLETFNISTFEWMASLRIDNYWFATMRTMLATLEALPLDETQDLRLDDWSRLASRLQGGKETSRTPAGRTSTTQDVVEAIFFTSNSDRHVAGLLDTLDDAMYRAHVIGWVDRVSVVELESVNPKLKNKLQLLEHLQDALDSLSSSRGDLSSFPANIAWRLQQQVLDFARCNAKVFRTLEA